jgi:hypothetical protein
VRLALALVVCVACSDPADNPCGATADAAPTGITGSVGGDVVTYGEFQSSENNDCPATDSTVISVTIEATQVGPTTCTPSCTFNLCLPRPDLLNGETVSLADPDRIRVDTLATRSGDCVTVRSTRAAPSGTATFRGFCTTAGTRWVLALDGMVPATRTCGAGAPEDTEIELSGEANVVGL